MSFKILYHPEVYHDIQEAIDWYNQQKAGLGKRFYTTLKDHLAVLRDSPKQFSVRYKDVHCMPMRTFPYLIHYRIDEIQKIVFIEAILNTYQSPEKWR